MGASITPGTTVRPSYLALWEDIARENQEKTRRLYEEGLGRGDLSSLNNTVSEDFRDLRHSERLANLTGQGHGSHLHLTFESDHRSEEYARPCPSLRGPT